ncbi:MAG TPA: hypothetical protein VLY20_05075 [Nitrospiria bacterium]|nr:hypothetical protein [Nitrospiria bacterium]
MNFDTAVAAREALKRAQTAGELGEDLYPATEAEERFASSTGQESAEAYATLFKIGETHPTATAFLEFLIYTTWNYVIECPSPDRFKKGLELCRRYLKETAGKINQTQSNQIRELRHSFLNGLGRTDDEGIEEYEEDAFAGGD